MHAESICATSQAIVVDAAELQAAQCSHSASPQPCLPACLPSVTDHRHCAVAYALPISHDRQRRHVAGGHLFRRRDAGGWNGRGMVRGAQSATMGMFPRLTLARCFRNLRASGDDQTLYVRLSSNVADDGAGEALNAKEEEEEEEEEVNLGSASGSADALGEAVQEQLEQFLQGSHEMTACALAAIDACSADVPQTVHFLELLAQQGSDRQKKQECLESLQSSFEKHMTVYEEEEQKYTQNLWGSMSTQQQDLQVRLDISNRLQTLRLQKQKLGEALLWLELMSGPPAI